MFIPNMLTGQAKPPTQSIALWTALHLYDVSLPLRYSQYRFTLRTPSRICLGAFPTAVLRSALGATLRQASCTTGTPTCNGCPVLASCAYGSLFEPKTAPSVLHSGFRDMPRPYVLHLPAPLPDFLPRGASFRFDLVLVESALLALPALVRGLRGGGGTKKGTERNEKGGMDLGKGRDRGRVELLRVEAVHPPSGPRTLWTHSAPRLQALPTSTQLGGTPVPACHALRLRLVAPLEIHEDGESCSAPGVEALVKALTRRVRALSAAHGRLTDVFDRDLLRAVDYARTLSAVDVRFRSTRPGRYSRKQGYFRSDALLGALTLSPGWEPLWPLLDAGRLLHIGKKATHGLGQYVLDEIPSGVARLASPAI